ncbi:maestro heat-like repeat-containing protein family member 1 isoform X4 [Dermochelys coriacea]|uniref:maestro heat-like repeat-containing protein family member 1 isoform X4 n=1 Tax=Dermochelys coriacea TaxID=27794 RepID=UPI0018E72A5E|nr:maestro heat-like repeat-containing protein family member 1 isoform X4 [Dermochelys coriacea]XP_038244383.1 maestro heat-like repeat-containing protein family member 1 isoform X4 [Dermochelys coriacea]
MTELRVKKLAVTLMDATTDKDPLVQEQIYNALCYLGESEPEEILNSCDEYLRQHEKMAYPHRIIILKAMEAVVKNNIAYLDKSTAKIVIFLASNEMTKSKEIIYDWQQAASNVLVAAGRRFINKVMEEVLTKFQPGILPHYFIMQTFANLSVSNVFGMVPFLNSILGTMLPMLGMAKQDHMKSVFCYALQHFSESIQEYLANLDKAPDPTVRKDTFSNEIFSAYDVLFNIWLQSREAKLRLAVVKALGPMSHLLPSEKLEEQLPKLVPGILALYKKHAEAFYVTKSLCQILEASVNVGSRTLDTQLDALLSNLHPQICAPVESSFPLSLKNHNEVLRCFTVLACTFPDRLLGFLLPKLENHNERIRVGTLIIMRQIINCAPSQMEIKKPFILSSMKLPLQDNSNKVKRAVVQVISAMAHHGYLEQAGGEVMIEYIIHQCALPPDTQPRKQTPEADDLTSDSVQNISINTLFLISTTVDRMEEVLWPYLLEFVTPIQFTSALTPLCRSLMHLATKKQEEGENAILIHYDTHANLPSPCALMARLLTVSSQPYLGDGRGAAALRLLNVLHLNIHPMLGQLWNKMISPLIEHLEANTEKSLSPKEWEDKLLLFLWETLKAISDNAWICQFSMEMCKQLSSYNDFPSEKNFLYKCIGTALRVCSNKDVVQKQLQELLETARYQEEAEREGLASSFGICAINHLDETLAKLEDFVKSDVFKKSVGLFSIFKDRSDNEVEKIKSTLILCYGYVARYAPKELVLSRIEADILRNIFHYFDTKVLGIKVETKDLTLKLCLIRSICMISQAIYNSAQSDAFIFSRKAELLAQMMEFIKTEPLDLLRTPIRQRAMISCTYLVILEPPLSKPDHVELIETCLSSVLALPPLDVLKERDGHVPDALHKETLYYDTISALKELLKSMLQKDLTPHGLQSMFEHLGPWIRSSKEHERERAVEVSATLLEFYRDKLNVSTVVPFYNLGVLVALFSPRCSDSLASIRLHAVDCAYYLLYIQLCYEGFAHDYRDEMVERLKDLKKGLEDPDFTILFNTCYNIAMVIGKRLPPDQLMSLLLTMFEGLADPDQNCSRAAAVMINALLKERGGVLLEKVPVIMALIHNKLQEVDEEHLRKAAQQTVYILASQHKTAVVSSLLGSSLPFDSHTCAMWKALATEPTLTPQILELLLDKVNRDVPYKENKSFLLGSTYERIATPLPFAATCALHEIMSAPESGAAVMGLYPHLFVALLLRVSCTVGVQLPKNLQSKERKSSSRSQGTRNLDPCSCAVEALRAMLTQGGSDEVVKSVESAGGWELMKSSDRHHDGIMLLARAMAKHAGPKLPLIVKNLFPMLNSVYDLQRITTTAFFAELLNSSVVSDLILLESMMDNMTGRQKDPCTLVRMLALRGLGNISSGSPDKVRKHGAQLLASMVNGMDDKDDPNNVVALEAMTSLSKLLDHVEERDIRSMLLHIAIRIRPFFDNENHELRTSSIVLFGNLTKFSAGNCEDVFFEQILNGLVTLLLHLQDPKPEVIKACKFALRMCGPSMGCEGLCDMFLSHLHEDRSLHYGEFMNDACKHLMQNYPEMLNRLISTNLFYFKSNWVDIRAAAPMFIGFLVLHVDEEHCKQVDLDQLLSSLNVLLKDPAPVVRMKVAEALGRLVRVV